MNKSITVLGGDSRQLYMSGYLKEKGYDVRIYACEHGKYPSDVKDCDSIDEAMKAEIVVLPLPVSKNGNTLNTPLSSIEIRLKEITDRINDSHLIFYGMGSIGFSKNVQARAFYSCDYFNIEGLIYKNAMLTSEGIISIVLDKLPITVFGMKAAITGYGRIGTFTAEKLKCLGADVTVFARDEMQRIKAQLSGMNSLDISSFRAYSGEFDVIINTVPHQVIDRMSVGSSKKSVVFIEAASAPYGIDSDACALFGRTLVKAFSLPGKTAPKSAGIIIGETIDEILREVK
ncbi:MAG: hypothetical protein IJN70_09300 [Clostridia bacterium]|nr:hypothetical protein [Clostridia bacterium]